jgi:hypothetical protein
VFSRRHRLLIIFAAISIVVGMGASLGLHWFADSRNQPFVPVEDGLYIGEWVKQPPRGTRAVVNLCGRPDPYEVEATFWEPVFEAGKEPSPDWLQRGVAFIAEQRRANRTTYVHCLNGVNRSAALVTAYLMQEHGWGRDEALAYLRKKRPVVQPNPTLMQLLAEWEDTLKSAPGATQQGGNDESPRHGR